MKGRPHAILRATNADADRPARGNIIPLRRTDDADSSDEAPMRRVGERDRPAPPRSHDEARFRLALILCGSLIVHAAVFAFFRPQSEMTASVAEDAITVEIVVGADSAAGTAQVRSDAE